MALSQLSRDVEKRAGTKMPQLSDLRESGAIEQDADIVMFMYRPEYYSINVNENGDSMNGETHIKFAKNRNGALDTIKLRAALATQQFYDFQELPKQLGLNGKNFIAVGSKMNNDIDDDTPF
jgi:replicative DNA helicase